MTIDPIAYLRTILPALIGSLLTWAGVHLAPVTSFLDGIDPSWRTLAYAVLTAAVISVYYWVARQAGKKWPWVERIMLGSAKLPIYSAAAATSTDPAVITSIPGTVTGTLELTPVSADPVISADPVTVPDAAPPVDVPKHLAE